MRPERQFIHIRVTPEYAAWLRDQAARAGQSITEYVVGAVAARADGPAPRHIPLPVTGPGRTRKKTSASP